VVRKVKNLRDFEEQVLGYTFCNTALLEEALTHPSIDPQNKKRPFERLEFLGDRVLGLVVGYYLYQTYPDDVEGDLALRLSSLVRRESLYLVAQDLSLHNFLAFDRKILPPFQMRILADGVEALLGALYLDGGEVCASEKILHWWAPLFEDLKDPQPSYKSLLQEWSQEYLKKIPTYTLLKRTGPDHAPLFQVQVQIGPNHSAAGKGASKKAAEEEAARILFESLDHSS
jgi:ribonuclease-3